MCALVRGRGVRERITVLSVVRFCFDGIALVVNCGGFGLPESGVPQGASMIWKYGK